MKKLTKYLFLAASLIYFSCESPAPVQLEADSNIASDEFELEIPVENSDTFISSDYDSVGTVKDSTAKTLIIVNGIKRDYKLITRSASLGKAIFYDDSYIMNSDGRRISRRTKNVNSVFFETSAAALYDYKISYYDKGRIRDTIAGPQYIVYNNHPRLGFDFPYNGSLPVRVRFGNGNAREVQVETPPEITGSVEVKGKRADGSLIFNFQWEGLGQGTVEIILGGYLKGTTVNFPVYKFLTADDGNFVIPAYLVKAVKFERFEALSFSMIRKKEAVDNSDMRLGKTLILAQSIHNIKVDLPN